MNEAVINNFSKVRWQWLLLPIAVITTIVIVLLLKNSLSVEGYINIQKEWFFSWNWSLSQYPILQYNLTQIGDALIFLSFLTLFIIYTPKLWEALISSLLISVIFSVLLKEYIDVTRPYSTFGSEAFTIIGESIGGSASLPSGHSITTFAILSVLWFAFQPQKKSYRWLWYILFPLLGFSIAFTRVGVGAHFPLDVVVGSSIGFFSGVVGILFSRKYRLWNWVNYKKYYPIFMALFAGGIGVLIIKIIKEPLFIFYLSLASIIYSLYAITKVYIQK